MSLYRLLVVGAIAATCFSAEMEQKTNKENMVRDRGQTPLERYTLQHGRPSPESEDVGAATLEGILIDGSCRYRANLNLSAQPETQQTESPAQPPYAPRNNPPVSGAVSAKGITVDAATIAAERGVVMESHVPDMRERQSDPTCAVTEATTSFALLTTRGRLLDLDEGGNTLALETVESSDAGRAMLNGQGPGVKPRVAVKGRVQNGHKLVALAVTPLG